MAIQHLTEEQIRTWTLEEKDRWWLNNVYRGDMPQLTWRAAITGFLLGGILSATNLYIGAKTGWSMGVGVTSVILAFAMFRTMSKMGLAREFTILENNCMQSIATAAGYMTGPLISSLGAYMVADGRLLPWHQMMIWNIAVSVLGVLFAFPMKRRFINDEQHPFPEGRAAGVVMDTLHHADERVGLLQAKTMIWAGLIAGGIKFFQSTGIQEWVQFRVLRLKGVVLDHVIHFPETLADICGWFNRPLPRIRGIDMGQLTVNPALELSLIGAGGLMGIRAGISLMIGAILNYCVLAPWMIELGQITPTMTDGVASYQLRRITLWSLWPGVACMVAASFVAFFANPRIIIDPFRKLLGGRRSSDVLAHIEFPLWISAVGIPVVSLLAAWLANLYFGVDIWMCLIGLPLTFVLTLVAANSTALTGITPVSATAKITQLFYGVAQPGNIRTNIATVGLTGEVVSNAANLLMDIKPGYMLGAKPRQQAIGHLIGIVSGSIFSVPLFYLLFARNVDSQGIASIQSDKFPMPSVTVWKAIADVLTEGIHTLPYSARYAALAGVLIGCALEVVHLLSKGRYSLSAVALGLAFVIDFSSSFAMCAGAVFFWLMGVGRSVQPSGKGNSWVTNHEPICAGIIAGAALVGILDAVIVAFVL
jgi:uncharacterized oligopeptide transporter (OPT) family protein